MPENMPKETRAERNPGGVVSSLEKSAFWIYGVTAMVMREPFASTLRHAATAGLGDWQVQLEILRVAVVLMVLSRLFLSCGIYFELVYMRADSPARFPRQNYPVDFLAGLLQFLIVVAASTTLGLHQRIGNELGIFSALIALFLVSECMWLVLARALGFSSVPRIAEFAKANALTLLVSVVAGIVTRFAGAAPVRAEEVALMVLICLTALQTAKLLNKFGES